MAKATVTAAVAAEHCCISPSRFRDLVDLGVIKRQTSKGYSLNECRKQYISYLQRVAAGHGADNATLSKQRVKLEGAKTEAIEFRNAVNRGDYVRLEVLAREVDEMIIGLRSTGLGFAGSISDTVATACGCDRALVFNIIDAAMREMLETMSNLDFKRKVA